MRKKQRREKKSIFRKIQVSLIEAGKTRGSITKRAVVETDKKHLCALKIPKNLYPIVDFVHGSLHGHEFEAKPFYSQYYAESHPLSWTVRILKKEFYAHTLWGALGLASKFALGYNALVKSSVFSDTPKEEYDEDDYDY